MKDLVAEANISGCPHLPKEHGEAVVLETVSFQVASQIYKVILINKISVGLR